MAFIGGDVLEITYNHPTIGSGTFYVKSNEDTTYNFGGPKSDDDENMIAGNGVMIDKITRSRWSFEATIAWDMMVTNEQKVLNQLSASPEQADWTIAHINGSIYGAKGKPVGDIPGSGQNATIPLKLAGGGQLNKIA